MKRWIEWDIPYSSSPCSSYCLAAASVDELCDRQFPEQPVFPLGEEKDYMIWLAHSTDPGDYGDGCILGYKEQFLRLRKSSVCQNGRDYAVTKQPSVCLCSLEDFLWYRPPSAPFLCWKKWITVVLQDWTILQSFSFPPSPRAENCCCLLRKLRHREREPKPLIIGQKILYRTINYWAEPAATPRNPDLAMIVRRRYVRRKRLKNREGDKVKTLRKVAPELRGHWTLAESLPAWVYQVALRFWVISRTEGRKSASVPRH